MACRRTRSRPRGRRSSDCRELSRGCGEPEVTRAGDMTITNTPLALEAGDYTARIAFRDDRTIAGLHILERQTS